MDDPNDFGSAFDAGRALSNAWTAIKRNAPLLWLGGCVRGCLRGGGGGGGGGADEHEKSSAILRSGWDSLAHLGGVLPHPVVGAGGFDPANVAFTGLAMAFVLVVTVVSLLVYAWFVPGWLRANAEIVRTGRSSLGTLFGTTETFGRMLVWTLLKGAVLLGVSMLTSKGASGVTGAGFITLVATLAVIPQFPIAAVALLVGIDRFMSECRALTNFIGNGVATLAIARWEGHLDRETMARELKAGA